MIEICSVGSSSSGNSYIIKACGRAIILDVGLPAKKINAALAELGIGPEEIEAVLITHEHSDHVKSVRAMGRKCSNAVFCVSRGTAAGTENFRYIEEERIRYMAAGDSYVIRAEKEEAGYGYMTVSASAEEGAGTAAVGAAAEAAGLHGGDTIKEGLSEYPYDYKDITIKAFSVSHDAAEPLGFTVETCGEKLAVVTDTGIVTDEIFEAVKDADTLVFESNHDEQMLMFGEYPYPLKMRIKGERGHLSNDYAGEMLARLLGERQPGRGYAPLRIMLAHLSFHNNAPFFARQAVKDALEKNGFEEGRDYILEVAAKEGLTFFPEE